MSTKHIRRFRVRFIENRKQRTVGHMYSREEALSLQQHLEYERGLTAWVL